MKTLQNPVIKNAEINDKETIKNLMQFYFYDFSEFVEAYVGNNGLFDEYTYLNNYWEEKERFPYLIEKEGKIAGFILVREVQDKDKRYWSISEFFIMKKFRLSGLGKYAAHQVFQIHKGNWEVFQIESNKPAQAFWRKVIKDYTDEQFAERTEEGKVIQAFCS
ncbi:GNAT family N-acetyltransferase [Fictibacillus arsenicus]|uniref:GNAT family N-acetyltransferase n=1 Tax=Fictibacillus arsenicus TaxID=255247 RepID=A0A1B1Z833_9BACL|nr:GNAT family N-acetyltransferase [Fictibacillus arsenicus]ANX13615.1 GNAT family N-acetyltransferase [Fictibacillus arsenicus]